MIVLRDLERKFLMSPYCFLLGNRDAPADLLPRMEETIERIVLDQNITLFIVGNRGAFDLMAASAVKRIKKYCGVQLLLLLAYHPAERPVPMLSGFDGTYYPEGMEMVPRQLAITRANHLVVDRCYSMITYSCHPGNSEVMCAYARSKGKLVINLAQKS